MNLSRRQFTCFLASAAAIPQLTLGGDKNASAKTWSTTIAHTAKTMPVNGPIKLLIPHGSAANVQAATQEFTRLSGIACELTEVPVDEINIELILQARSSQSSFDVALPATFGLPDLVEANAIAPLNDLAERFEPAGFSDGYLYRKGDYYQGNLYGYQTDGDVYLLFYNKRMLNNPREQAAYKDLTGNTLRPARSWEELDSMMAFFNRPDENVYGGSLFRNAGYLAWEWWARFHAKGYFPFADDLTPNINNAVGVQALNELVAATASLTPHARTNSLFENWTEFSKGNVFCNIGWGGTQKYLMQQPTMRDNVVHSVLPGPIMQDNSSGMGYFNWGWNYTVSSQTTRKDVSYLLTLFCTCPDISTLAVRHRDGYFDPFRQSHYADAEVKAAYGDSFLEAHQTAMSNSIPDFYIRGQSSYLDALRQQIIAAVNGEVDSQSALDTCAKKWNHINRRLGIEQQRAQWQALKASYPEGIRNTLLSS